MKIIFVNIKYKLDLREEFLKKKMGFGRKK